jgi:uncharacterized protein (AIM24 family)
LFANSKRWKRVLTGESLFMTAFINQQHHSKAKYLLLLILEKFIDLTEFQGKFICQKSSFYMQPKAFL